MRRVILSVSFADTFRATLTSGLLVLGSLVILQTQLINSASAEVTFLNKWGSFGTGDGEFGNPWGIALSDTGQVYMADRNNDRIQRFFDSEAWVSGTNTFVNGTAGPTSVAVGPGDILGSTLILDASKGLVVGDTTTVNTGGTLLMSGGSLTTPTLLLDAVRFLRRIYPVLTHCNLIPAG